MPGHASVFRSRQPLLAALSAAYVLGLAAAHAGVGAGEAQVWTVAALFAVLMNVTYVIEARGRGRHVGREAGVAGLLSGAAVLGAVAWPGLVIAAVLLHGVWDLAKHLGAGVPFLGWYTLGCCAVDLVYAGGLALYWLS
jgi:hypothetical protein